MESAKRELAELGPQKQHLLTVVQVIALGFSKILSCFWIVSQMIYLNFGVRRAILLNPMPGVGLVAC